MLNVEQEDNNISILAPELPLLERMEKSGLYSPRGTTTEQRKWIKDRDAWSCQFYEYNETENGVEWLKCPKRVDPENPPKRGSQRWQLEVHHIYGQSQMRKDPQKFGGENPHNLITLCAGLAGEIGHHDLLQATMILAKMTYKHDKWAYAKWIDFAHQALALGMSTYNPEWDGMLKSIAHLNSKRFVDNGASAFPKHPLKRIVA